MQRFKINRASASQTRALRVLIRKLFHYRQSCFRVSVPVSYKLHPILGEKMSKFLNFVFFPLFVSQSLLVFQITELWSDVTGSTLTVKHFRDFQTKI